MSAKPQPDPVALPGVTLEAVTAANWRVTLDLAVPPEQQRFVANYVPIAAIALAKAFVRPGGLHWQPLAVCTVEQMVGFVELAFTPGSSDQYWIYHFFIDGRYQGKGYGQAALHALVQLVQTEHPACERLQLQVHPDNERAQHVYQQVGFRPTGATIDGEPVYALALR